MKPETTNLFLWNYRELVALAVGVLVVGVVCLVNQGPTGVKTVDPKLPVYIQGELPENCGPYIHSDGNTISQGFGCTFRF